MTQGKGKTLVIVPTSGIGDMIFHLRHIRAIARVEGPITFLTKSRTMTKEWLGFDPAIQRLIYVDDMWKQLSSLLPELRSLKFQKSWILHKSFSYAMLPFLLRIPKRLGFGYGAQRYLLTSSPFLPPEMKGKATIPKVDKMFELLKDDRYYLDPQDQIPPLCPEAHQHIIQKFSYLPRPWICFGFGGIGSQQEMRRWPLAYFTALINQMGPQIQGTIFLCGSKQEDEEAQIIESQIQKEKLKTEIYRATDLPLRQTFALLKEADLYVGNDTSLLNIAGSFGTPTVGLFGCTLPLTYTSAFHAITPPPHIKLGKEGMEAIFPVQVFKYLKDNDFIKIEI